MESRFLDYLAPYQEKQSPKNENKSLHDTYHFIEEHTPFVHWLKSIDLYSSYESRPELILQALTHSSFAHENPDWPWGDNERLEFLGDAILDAVLSKKLFLEFSDKTEGELSKLRSCLVNESTLALWGHRIGLAPMILLGRGEAKKETVEEAIIADAFEAIIGAVSLINEGDTITLVEKWVEQFDENRGDELPLIDDLRAKLFDPKTNLQEATLELFKETPIYRSIEADDGIGFESQVFVNEACVGFGNGTSKKKAEVMAARDALIKEKYKKKVVKN